MNEEMKKFNILKFKESEHNWIMDLYLNSKDSHDLFEQEHCNYLIYDYNNERFDFIRLQGIDIIGVPSFIDSDAFSILDRLNSGLSKI